MARVGGVGVGFDGGPALMSRTPGETRGPEQGRPARRPSASPDRTTQEPAAPRPHHPTASIITQLMYRLIELRAVSEVSDYHRIPIIAIEQSVVLRHLQTPIDTIIL